MLLGAREAMLAGGDEPAPPTPIGPYDAEIEYIQVDGGKGTYVDTGYNTDGVGITVEGQWRTTDSTSGEVLPLVGIEDNASVVVLISIISFQQRVILVALYMTQDRWGGIDSTMRYEPLYVGGYSSEQLTIKASFGDAAKTIPAKVKIDEYPQATVESSSAAAVTSTKGSLLLFKGYYYQYGSNVTCTSDIKCHYVQIKQDGILVRDFIPVRIGTTGYFYDRANPTGGPLGNGLYPSSGTGDFVLGPDKT